METKTITIARGTHEILYLFLVLITNPSNHYCITILATTLEYSMIRAKEGDDEHGYMNK